jgi:hypothetical protein
MEILGEIHWNTPCSYGFSPFSHGFPMVFPWETHGTTGRGPLRGAVPMRSSAASSCSSRFRSSAEVTLRFLSWKAARRWKAQNFETV